MKKLFVFTAALVMSITALFAQTDKYNAAMAENLKAIEAAFKNPSELLALSNKFERIANAEKTQWLPYYWAAYCQVNYAFMQQEDKSKIDGLADKATELINKADALQPNNSEISCIRSMIATSKLMVDPMSRYMEYGAESNKQLEAAMKQDPTNPRPEFLIGQSLKYTPEQFGGGCKPALEKFEASIKKYETFKAASDFHPNWGKEYVQSLIDECKK
ncbi:MAG: hypothetical protein EOP53_11135 [Sphingobacteriales bacterium]|nr:MAG: hypothetical protein EOP53_11135 [Sphingobacteriales bacterium]